MKYAQIVNGRVHGVFEYESLPAFAPNIQMVPLGEVEPQPKPGWLYDGNAFSEPPPPPAPDYGTKLSRLKFEQRFTDSEWVAIDLASIGATAEAAGVRRVLRLVSQAEHIDLSLPEIQDGMAKLVALVPEFTQARADEIMNTPVSEKEQWNG